MNKKGFVPKCPGSAGRPISRANFLNGDVRVYYGPGQGIGVSNTYRRPTDWPAAGTLLRVPQVVWLSCYLAGAGPTFGTTMRVRDYYGASHTVPQLFNIEMMRLRDVFRSAKDHIETIRPERTFVQVQEMFTEDWTEFTIFGLSTGNTYYNMISAPSEEDFFGTNFLAVHTGQLASAPSGWGYYYTNTSGCLVDGWKLGGTWQDHADSNAYKLVRENVVAAYPKFAGYAARLYGHNIDWSGVDAILRDPNPDGTSNVFTDWPEAMNINHSLIHGICDDLADYGFVYGGECEDLNTQGLISLIADHFGFDPDTGDDLPS